jgi:hypothetical protein
MVPFLIFLVILSWSLLVVLLSGWRRDRRLLGEARNALINRKIKNKICGADDLERLGSGVTVWRMAHLSAAVVRL